MSVKEDFLDATKNHEMTILMDNGVYRHIRFQAPQSSIFWFELVTWPGCLTIHGDGGSYSFARLPDMFDFFGGDDESGLYINKDYWSEKVFAVDRTSPIEEFSRETFEEACKDYIDSWFDALPCPSPKSLENKTKVLEAVKEEIFRQEFDAEAQIAARDFSFEYFNDDDLKRVFCFDELYEYDFNKFTDRFVWNLYAIVWGIAKYKKSKDLVSETVSALI